MLVMLTGIPVQSAKAQTYQALYSFSGAQDGRAPQAGLIRDAAGNLYGTTGYGGGYTCYRTGCGTVFKLDSTGNETVFYPFNPHIGGFYPLASLIPDSAGNLYGTTYYGGDRACAARYGCGTVFKLDSSGKETVLHRFAGGGDGTYPQAALVRDPAGNLYGTTHNGGGQFDGGTVFKLDTAGAETVLHKFSGAPDGQWPDAALIRDAQGNLYGTTEFGGDLNGDCPGLIGCGVVFKIDASGNETVLYSFIGGANGAAPLGRLVRDSAGNLYGMTVNGGDLTCLPPSGCGVVFKLDSTGAETVLYSFVGQPTDGSRPFAGLIRDPAGNLYGTTSGGGAYGYGTVFELDASGNEIVLYSFTGRSDGSSPRGDLIRDPAGNLYGTTFAGGNLGVCYSQGCGVVFKLTP